MQGNEFDGERKYVRNARKSLEEEEHGQGKRWFEEVGGKTWQKVTKTNPWNDY